MKHLQDLFKGSYSFIKFFVTGEYNPQVLENVTNEHNFAIGIYEVRKGNERGVLDVKTVEEFVPESLDTKYKGLLDANRDKYVNVMNSKEPQIVNLLKSMGVKSQDGTCYFGFYNFAEDSTSPDRAIGIIVPKDAYSSLSEQGLGLIF